MSTSTVHRQAEAARSRGRRARRNPNPASVTVTDQIDLLSITDKLTPSPIDADRIQTANAAITAGAAGRGTYETLADAAIRLPHREES